jgi:hypothetical protein
MAHVTKVRVGVRDPTIMLHFVRIVRRSWRRVPQFPEPLNELISFLLGTQLQEGIPLLIRNYVSNILRQPLAETRRQVFGSVFSNRQSREQQKNDHKKGLAADAVKTASSRRKHKTDH